jgi:hypothetical protein
MDKINPDTYCGIYCGACSVLMHGETGRADGFAGCLGSVPKEEIACGGCKSGTLYAGCRMCSFRDCALEKGVAHCVDCADYPCKMYAKWQSAAMFLPHVREAAFSLEAIKRDGVDAWLAAQKKRWSCPYCGTPCSWYASECGKCGRRLASEAYEMSGWRKLLCRLVLPIVYRKGKAKRPNRSSQPKKQG